MVQLKAYHVKHKKDFSGYLQKAKLVANYALKHKNKFKLLTSKYVKKYGLNSSISNQILRKYGRGTIKKVSNVNLVIPNQRTSLTYKTKDGTIKQKNYYSIEYNNGVVHIKALKLKFRWNPGKHFIKIHQIEINEEKYMLTVSFKDQKVDQKYNNVLGIDLNCGIGRSVANCANLKTNEILNLGVQGPNIRKYYYKKRKKHKMKGDKEKRIMRDLDHKISRKIVNYALKHKLKIVVENLKGIRTNATKKKGLRNVNRFVNSWSFYRLQTFIEYKSKELGIPFEKINPHYTSQECSYCSIIGERNGDTFICKNKKCGSYKKERHSDINAAFNIGKRSLQLGGRA
jgi:putative transposase